jgi:hypothetical protein
MLRHSLFREMSNVAFEWLSCLFRRPHRSASGSPSGFLDSADLRGWLACRTVHDKQLFGKSVELMTLS